MIKNNLKGMTLVEIVVVLLISSIIMLICGTLIVNSMRFFNNTADANIEKLAVDKISEHIRRTISYASDIQITNKKPGDLYHSISISEQNTLLIDDKEQFSISFYNQSKFTLAVRRYEKDYRIDLTYAFVDESDTVRYQTSETIELINMKGRIQDSDNYQLTSINNTMRIYFIDKGYGYRNDSDQPEVPVDPSPGDDTVKDEALCMDETESDTDKKSNNRGVWQIGNHYKKGDFVRYPDAQGALYRSVVNNHSGSTSTAPGVSFYWKKIDENYTLNSNYEIGDIVLYGGKYYQSKQKSNEFIPTDTTKWYGPAENAQDLITMTGVIPKYKNCALVEE